MKLLCQMPQSLENQRRPFSNVSSACRSLKVMRGTWEPKWENVWPQPSIAEQANDVGHNSQRGACGSKKDQRCQTVAKFSRN